MGPCRLAVLVDASLGPSKQFACWSSPVLHRIIVATMRSVPVTYNELAASIDADTYPSERTWIDFKRRLYPDDAGDKEGRAKVSLELAKDMASMAVLGGVVIYGVAENKAKHLFVVDPMSLPVGLHETVDAVARDRITPPLLSPRIWCQILPTLRVVSW